MKPSLFAALDRRRPEICARWEALLRLEREPSALGRPSALVHLFDHTLHEVLAAEPGPARAAVPERPACRCECNPLRHYFTTLEQALLEALIWAQAEDPALTATEKVASVGEVCRRLRRVAQREMVLLDGLCRNAGAESRPA